MDNSAKGNVKSKNTQAQHIQEIQDTVRRLNLWIIETEEETQVKGTINILIK